MSTWLPFTIRRDGPAWKQSYPGVPSRGLALIEGEVKHSAEGSLRATFAVLDGPRQASWHFTIAKDGRVFQHYPLEAITWHAGLPGDRRFDTSLIGNLTLIGEEHEGIAGEAITAVQYNSSVEVSKAIRTLAPHVGASAPALRMNLWEHNWLTATSCPSGRIAWARLIQDLEDEVTDAEFLDFWNRLIVPSYPGGLTQVKIDMKAVQKALKDGAKGLGQ